MSVVDLDETPADGRIPRRARRALGLAGALVLLALGVYLVAFHDVAAAQADAHAYFTFSAMGREHPQLAALAQHIVDLCQPLPYVYLAAATVIVALIRRRWTLALALVVMIPAVILTTEILKPLLAHPRPALGVANTPWPARAPGPAGIRRRR